MTAVDHSRDPDLSAQASQAFHAGNLAAAERLCRLILERDPRAAKACHMLGVIRARQGRLADARELLECATGLRPDKPAWVRNLAQVCLRQGRPLEAVSRLEAVLPGGDACLHGALNQARMASVPQWHFPMLNDARRAAAYRDALRRAVRPGSIVLDIGAGTGLLSFMAAESGAAHVYAVERAPALADCARRAIRASPHRDRITLLEMDASRLRVGVHLPRTPDVLVTEVFDASLLAEGALATLRRAHTDVIGARTVMIPHAAEVLGGLVESDALREEVSVPILPGLDTGGLQRYAPMYLERCLHRFPHRAITPERRIARFDFADPAALVPGERRRTLSARTGGRADAVAMRFRLLLAEGVEYESGTEANQTHWGHWIRFLEPTAELRAGQAVTLRVCYDDNFLAADLLDGPA